LVIKATLLIIAFVSCFLLNQVNVFAEADTEAPILNSVEFTPQSVKVGDIITFKVDVVEEGVGVQYYDFSFSSWDDGDGFGHSCTIYPTDKQKHTGVHTLSFKVAGDFYKGTYHLTNVSVCDQNDNQRYYGWTGDDVAPDHISDGGENICYINGKNELNVNNNNEVPVYGGYKADSIQLLSTTAKAGSSFKIQLNITLDSKPITAKDPMPVIMVIFISGDDMFGLDLENCKVEKNGVVSGTFPVNNNVKPGSYKVCQIDVKKPNGFETASYIGDAETFDLWGTPYIEGSKKYLKDSYDDVKCYFEGSNSIFITNDSKDLNKPIIRSLQILDPEVSKPGVVRVKVDIEDDSGLEYAEIMLSLGSSEFSSGQGTIWLTGQKRFTGIIKIPVSMKNKAGKYYIQSIGINDTSGNHSDYWHDPSYVDEKGPYFFGEGSCQYLADNIEVNVKEEFNIDFETSLSNSHLSKKLTDMEEGKTARILIDGKAIAKKELFEAIKGKDKTIVFYYENYQWVFYGKDIVNPKDIVLTIFFERIYGVDYGYNNEIMQISFANNGVLPGKANIRIKADYTHLLNGLTGSIYLYYLNQSTETISLEDQSNPQYILDDTNHWCYFDIDHNSKYLLSSHKLKNKVKVTKVRIKGDSHKIAAGKKIRLKAFVSPSNATNKKVRWKSSNKMVATVDKNGLVKIKKGTAGKRATITAISKDNSAKKAIWKIRSVKGVVKKVTLSGKKSVKAGKTIKLKVKVKAGKGAYKKIKWKCNHTEWATVDQNGKVKGLKNGKGKTVTITAYAVDGSGKKANKKIKVR